jgi:preprotein translocase subunit SecA
MQALVQTSTALLLEGRARAADDFDRWGRAVAARALWVLGLQRRRMAARYADRAMALAPAYAGLDNQGFANAVAAARQRLVRAATHSHAVPEVMALVREASRKQFGFGLHRVQLIGGAAMAAGSAIEMRTGEGKTLAALLPACLAALRGCPVHIVTANDYLASRDEAELHSVYQSLGLTSGCITHDQDRTTRAEIYRSDVVYGSNKEFAFDYLRDRLLMRGMSVRAMPLRAALAPTAESPIMTGRMAFCIVDEADSVLVDEARTPLILSRSVAFEEEEQVYENALVLARDLVQHEDFEIDPVRHSVELTPAGNTRVENRSAGWPGIWQSRLHRADIVTKALHALHILKRDVHFIVSETGVVIVDEFTGRVLEGRSWSDGLQQLVELKEGLALTPPTIPTASVTFQRFFRAYPVIAGMSGTLSGAAVELGETYGIPVVRIPTNRQNRLRQLPTQVLPTLSEKIEAIAIRAEKTAAAGQPVLIGCRSVLASATLSEALTRRGMPHQVLNARQDANEAEIVAGAGRAGQITVATNMAGRGTDIRLDEAARRAGGLHVMVTERHDSRRIDRQLQGRSGRQGDPGTTETFLSLDDDLVPVMLRSGWMGQVLRRLCQLWSGRIIVIAAIALSQGLVERRHRRIRRQVTRLDELSQQMLAFAGEWD